MTNREGVGESRLIRLVRKWRLPLLLLLTGVVALDVRGAMGIASNLAYTACIGNAADPARRIEACTQIIDNQADGPDKRATAYFKRAYAWSMEGDLDRAIADSDQAISLNPEYASAYYNRGYDWATKGDYDRAIADYGQAIAFDPKSSAAYNNRGLAWAYKGDNDRAIADYNLAIIADPKNASAYLNRGGAWAAEGAFDHAIADYNQAIAFDPTLIGVYENRGLSWGGKATTTAPSPISTSLSASIRNAATPITAGV
ncbi:tetratricopeptide repeat protein [Mesorhizobium sp. M4A.F.Ca.ET.022.05.2.1]|uniref:tetratricopeptide repeat protein n=1 Tax=Mesorhizobium sp. M4A.F.Ca.ET.022.05.2.1 TaxID=2496653 RepID=UPI0016734B18|nr:tetratricopeptide repeat protein [Mesorhizobium sp. M4A.F.Ca.ET.022.05.2.1]